MARIALTDGSGMWFNDESAVKFKENTRFDGRNQISVPTGSQWHHEWLYFTKGGKWIKNSFSNYQGTLETYEQIDESEAITWLILNQIMEGDEINKLPVVVQDNIAAGFAAAEI